MPLPDITLRLCAGGMTEITLGGGRAILSTPDEFAKSTIVREVKTVLETKPYCHVKFGDAGIGIAKYINGELQWFAERKEGDD